MFAPRLALAALLSLACIAFLPRMVAVEDAVHAGAIRPGEMWPDDRGQNIQAHGGGIIKLADTWYWFGEDRSPGNDHSKRYVACYSSTDLMNWKFRRQVVELADPEDLGSRWILERPKVFQNPSTGQFVMYAHLDGKGGYRFAHVAVFTCDTIDGNYRYVRSFRPLNQESRDIGQFVDDDGSAYLIFESRPTGGFFLAKLSADYLGIERQTCFIHAPLEGGALVHYDGLYYVVASHLTGWRPNPNVYATAARLEGPWTEFKNIAPPEVNTYGSQSTMLLKVAGTKKTTVIFMGDIWEPRALGNSSYLWMPIEIGLGQLHLPKPAPWTIDVKTGDATLRVEGRR